MKAAADKTVAKHSDEIAKSLLDSLRKGNLNSAKLLFALAEGQIDLEDEEVMQRLCSYAEKLASEPEWNGEVQEG
jgi:nickel-dependent lactate racemase